ncbi:DUF1206 domain-containing protein [Stackebrandtia nassauensis]|uniref:DUF1206 domain-containing protein n=1 Tax=Stackebrandtia nassauensis (strain DSM 44728 / CIP 108903 / NRRL B-16338 / NBRC 102104 / LLR-40K-21) TaxID=446470 RepID=D3PZ31_STANL|nr:DUF1206 domain-containing protein [Stackebrandtia nassauensis]ADD45460.1 protein of unknown function DUF1206 [Stackebrandtia nassauensis DSM 44728]
MGSDVSRTARKAAKHPAIKRLAKPGFAARGVLYALLGVLALQVAFGDGGSADKSGAIHLVASQPLGEVLLWVMAVGLTALTLWQLGEAIFGRPEVRERVESAARAVVYTLLVISIVSLLLWGTKTASTDSQSKDATSAVFELPGGQVLVGLAALGLIGLGGYWVYEGWTQKFMKDMFVTNLKAARLVPKLGTAGYIARGIIAVTAGILIGRSAITYDPDKAVGIDGALKSLVELPIGPVVLAMVAVGLILFAVYCFAEARWHRV